MRSQDPQMAQSVPEDSSLRRPDPSGGHPLLAGTEVPHDPVDPRKGERPQGAWALSRLSMSRRNLVRVVPAVGQMARLDVDEAIQNQHIDPAETRASPLGWRANLEGNQGSQPLGRSPIGSSSAMPSTVAPENVQYVGWYWRYEPTSSSTESG